MNDYERMLDEISSEGIEVIHNYKFDSERLKGLYCDGTIALSKDLSTDAERKCVLAEEYGHYKTAYGDITLQKSVSDRKQELKGRYYAYNKCIGLTGILDCYKSGCTTAADMAERLNVTEPFLLDALDYYHRKYGAYTKLDNYVIYFEPRIAVFELI